MDKEIKIIEELQAHIVELKTSLAGLEGHVQDLMNMEQTHEVTEAAAAAGGMGLTLFVFALAIFLGVELIAKVPSQLHTPLMSGSNAISGITIVGALIALQNIPANSPMVIILGTLAVITATVNVVGGYLVTDRMLGMFKSKKEG
jgi:NAD(P) transhydrogenase subunit alpha